MTRVLGFATAFRPRDHMPLADPNKLLAQRLTFLLNRAAAMTNSFGHADFRQMGLSISEARVLIFLNECGPSPIGRIVDIVGLEYPTLSHLLRRLEKAELVERRRHEADARSVQVELTPAGLELARECHDLSVSHEKQLAASLGKDQIRQLKALLLAITDNASKASARRQGIEP
jgi:MarR family transcriptional regulator, organic hydroperoxide resistance regulator